MTMEQTGGSRVSTNRRERRPESVMSRDGRLGPPHLTRSDALFLDVDGTLLDFASTPDGVTAPAGLVAALGALAGRLGGALAFVSGRRIAEIDHLFAPLRLPAAGVHGGEIRLTSTLPSSAVAAGRELPVVLLAAIVRAVQDYPGVFIEAKRFSVAVHYLKAPHLKHVLLSRIESTLSHHNASGVEVVEGRLVLEVKVQGFDKGTAVAMFLGVAPFRGRVPVFIGDDVTDEDGFLAARAAGGRAYSVSTPRGCAIHTFAGPQAVRDWLAAEAFGEDNV